MTSLSINAINFSRRHKLGVYKFYDFVKKSNINLAAGYWTYYNKSIFVAPKWSGQRMVRKFANETYMKKFVQETDIKKTEKEFEILSEKTGVPFENIYENMQMPFAWGGTDHAIFEDQFFYVKSNSSMVVRYNITEKRMKKTKILTEALGDTTTRNFLKNLKT